MPTLSHSLLLALLVLGSIGMSAAVLGATPPPPSCEAGYNHHHPHVKKWFRQGSFVSKKKGLSLQYQESTLVSWLQTQQQQQEGNACTDNRQSAEQNELAAVPAQTSPKHSLILTALQPPTTKAILAVRGGDSDDESEYEEDSDSDDEGDESSPATDAAAVLEQVLDITKTKVVPVVVAGSKKAYQVLTQVTLIAYKAGQRAVRAAMEGDDDEEDEEEDDEFETTMADQALKLATKVAKAIKRMVVAALDFSEEDDESVTDDDDDEEEEEEVDTLVVEVKAKSKTKKEDADDGQDNASDESTERDETPAAASSSSDFGSFLAESYNAKDGRGAGDLVIMGGSFKDALDEARKQARILLVFVPSEKPKGGGMFFFGGKKTDDDSATNDQEVIESLLSAKVVKAANKKARKKGTDTGSFAIWGTKAGSSEASSVTKQLKLQPTSKGEKRPILCAVYPSYVSGKDGGNMPKLVPKLLSQHANPPTEPEKMASWMSTIRKKHGQYYQALQKQYQEMEYLKERVEGYSESVKSDTERKAQEAKEKAEQKAKEAAEAKRKKELKERRRELKKSLPEDVKSGSDAKKISLRFADGRSGQRGFSSDQPLSVLFNWVDALFEMERETVVLTTLNGKMTFSWDEESNDTTLEDAGLGKMTAFRVTEKKEEEESSEADS